MTTKEIRISVLGLVVLAVLGGLIFMYNNDATEQNQPLVMSFEECMEAGYPVMESYPRQCRTASGELFVEKIDNSATNPNQTEPIVRDDCFVGGCSGEVCSDQEGAVSTCIYKPEYSCYKKATCERQASGKCGWTQNSTLSLCLSAE